MRRGRPGAYGAASVSRRRRPPWQTGVRAGIVARPSAGSAPASQDAGKKGSTQAAPDRARRRSSLRRPAPKPSVRPTWTPDAWTRVRAKAKTSNAIRRSKMRSSTQAANCDVTGTRSFTAIRYGRTNSPGRPNSVMAVNPITVADSRLRDRRAGASEASGRPPSAAPVRSRCRTSGSSASASQSHRRRAKLRGGERPIEPARRQLGADEPHQAAAGEDAQPATHFHV